MAGFFDSNPQDAAAILAAQRRQQALIDAVRETAGGLSNGVAPIQQADGGLGLVSSSAPNPPANLPALVGSQPDLIDASIKSIDLEEQAGVNRKALLEALNQKLPGIGTTQGPPGSQAAAQLPQDFLAPRGAAGYTSNPRGVDVSPTAAPVHVGAYRMTAEGEFVPRTETPLGLSSADAWGASLPAKSIAEEDRADLADAKIGLTGTPPPVATTASEIPSLTAPVTAEPPPEEPRIAPPSLTEPAPPPTAPFEPLPQEEEFGRPDIVGDQGE